MLPRLVNSIVTRTLAEWSKNVFFFLHPMFDTDDLPINWIVHRFQIIWQLRPYKECFYGVFGHRIVQTRSKKNNYAHVLLTRKLDRHKRRDTFLYIFFSPRWPANKCIVRVEQTNLVEEIIIITIIKHASVYSMPRRPRRWRFVFSPTGIGIIV